MKLSAIRLIPVWGLCALLSGCLESDAPVFATDDFATIEEAQNYWMSAGDSPDVRFITRNPDHSYLVTNAFGRDEANLGLVRLTPHEYIAQVCDSRGTHCAYLLALQTDGHWKFFPLKGGTAFESAAHAAKLSLLGPGASLPVGVDPARVRELFTRCLPGCVDETLAWDFVAADRALLAALENPRLKMRDANAALAFFDYARALKTYAPLAKAGFPLAQAQLGYMYLNGLGLPQDSIAAARWFGYAAKQGDAIGQFDYAVMLAEGEGVEKDEAASREWMEESAAAGYAPAQLQVAKWLMDQQPRDDTRIRTLLAGAAAAGYVEAQTRLAQLLGDTPEAVAWLRKAAQQKDPVAERKLGIHYIRGKLVPRSLEVAAGWLELAANQNDGISAWLLGTMYITGEGVPVNAASAVRLLEQAANQQYANAEFELGALFLNGMPGLSNDPNQAKRWLERAATHGHRQAQELLAQQNNDVSLGDLLAAARDFVIAVGPLEGGGYNSGYESEYDAGGGDEGRGFGVIQMPVMESCSSTKEDIHSCAGGIVYE